jgi:hypothetical protein
MNEYEMGGTCSTHEDVINAYNILVGNLKRRNLLGYVNVDGRIILKRSVKETRCADVAWIQPFQDRVH